MGANADEVEWRVVRLYLISLRETTDGSRNHLNLHPPFPCRWSFDPFEFVVHIFRLYVIYEYDIDIQYQHMYLNIDIVY